MAAVGFVSPVVDHNPQHPSAIASLIILATANVENTEEVVIPIDDD